MLLLAVGRCVPGGWLVLGFVKALYKHWSRSARGKHSNKSPSAVMC